MTQPRSSADSLDAVLETVEEVLKDPRIDPNRVYLTGYSMGGFGCWELAARAPEHFAAIISIAGGGNIEWNTRLVDVPIWAIHGAIDQVVASTASRRMINAIERAGGNPYYTEVPGIGHDSWTVIFRENSPYLKWMFEQRRKPLKSLGSAHAKSMSQ